VVWGGVIYFSLLKVSVKHLNTLQIILPSFMSKVRMKTALGNTCGIGAGGLEWVLQYNLSLLKCGSTGINFPCTPAFLTDKFK
jgi:hypothetical protein